MVLLFLAFRISFQEPMLFGQRKGITLCISLSLLRRTVNFRQQPLIFLTITTRLINNIFEMDQTSTREIPIDPALLVLGEAEEPQDGQQDGQQGLVMNTGVQDYSAPIQHYDRFGVAGLAPYYNGSDQRMPQVNYLNEPYPASYNPPYSNYYWNAPYNVQRSTTHTSCIHCGCGGRVIEASKC
ncbi:hypothetical protein BZA77DRAFT_345670, partial [Pyronema omphalodes]